MRTLLITDLHINSTVRDLPRAQIDCILSIFQKESPDEVIIMGDVFMYRKPSPSDLLAFKEIVDTITLECPLYVLRGNHDSETKADDGVTALSIFDKATIIKHVWTDDTRKRTFIPHYEDQQTILDALEMVPEDYTVFGHFGFRGCLNSLGDLDFDIPLNYFRSRTFLGHIHNHSSGQGGLSDSHKVVTTLGTQYTTNFGEADKDNYYGIIEDDEFRIEPVLSGPRHLVCYTKDLENNLDEINDPNYFTFLRIMVDATHCPIPYDKLNVAHIDVKYAPIFNEEVISSYTTERNLFSINDVIIEDYVDSANSTISKEQLMQGYRLLKDEN